jgi:hypothetical protein
VTLAPDRRSDARLRRPSPPPSTPAPRGLPAPRRAHDTRPVEFWSTSAIRAAVESGELTTWQRIVAALRRDPYGRTARQVEEVLETVSSYGISKALTEVLTRSRAHMEADERAEVARHVQVMVDRSGLGQPEFASRIGLSSNELGSYLAGEVSPSASLMVRMRRLSDRFANIKAQRPPQSE